MQPRANMKKLLNKIGNQVKLTRDERGLMRSELEAYIGQYSMPTNTEVKTPSSYWLGDLLAHSARRLVPIALVFIFFVGTGVSFAAEGALPGDILYPIKISVNEGLRRRLATTPSAKANLETELAARRLGEAELLSAQGRLASSTEATLALEFTARTLAARVQVDEMKQSGDTANATIVSTHLETTIAAHRAVIAELSSDEQVQEVSPKAGPEKAKSVARARKGRRNSLTLITAHVAQAEEDATSASVATSTTGAVPVSASMSAPAIPPVVAPAIMSAPQTLIQSDIIAETPVASTSTETTDNAQQNRAEKIEIISSLKDKIEKATDFRFKRGESLDR